MLQQLKGTTMQIESEKLDNGIIKIALNGRLDMMGNQDIEMKLTTLAATDKAGVLVDMTDVEFIASIGIRTLITVAKAQAYRGGKIVLCNLQSMVKEVLTTSGVDNIIDLSDDCDAAMADLESMG
jgi:anti-anti-sigma factor